MASISEILLHPEPESPEDAQALQSCCTAASLRVAVLGHCAKIARSCDGESVDLQPFMTAMERLRSSETNAPACCWMLLTSLVHDWCDCVLGFLEPNRSLKFNQAEKQSFRTCLQICLSRGLRHTGHVNSVDPARNPEALREYVGCLLGVFGSRTRQVSQHEIDLLRRFAMCDGDCVTFILDYASLTCSSTAVRSLDGALAALQLMLYSANSRNRLFGAVCIEAAQTFKLEEDHIDTLKQADATLAAVWDCITTKGSAGEAVWCPGLPGNATCSSFPIPALVATRGSARAIVNCMYSSLLLSCLDKSREHQVCVASRFLNKKHLYAPIRYAIDSLASASFGRRDLATDRWWNSFVSAVGLFKESETSEFPSEAAEDCSVLSSGEGEETIIDRMDALRISRAVYEGSTVSKVCMARNLFDAILNSAAQGCYGEVYKPCQFSERVVGGVVTEDRQTCGRLLRDLQNLANAKMLSRYLKVNVVAKQVSIGGGPPGALAALDLLIVYMQYHSSSRRSREKDRVCGPNKRRKTKDGRIRESQVARENEQ